MIGIKEHLADETILASDNYLGQYGSILKININKKPYRTKGDPFRYCSAYITFKQNISACVAIISIGSTFIPEHPKIKASYATTKYCKFYCKKKVCRVKGCNFYHDMAPNEDCIIVNDSLSNMQLFNLQMKYAFEYANKIFEDICSIMCDNKPRVLPIIQNGINFLKSIRDEEHGELAVQKMNEFISQKFNLKEMESSAEKDTVTFGSEEGSNNQNLIKTFSNSGSESKGVKKKPNCPLDNSGNIPNCFI